MTTNDIIYCLAGIRPLPATRSETEEAEITRRHLILDHEDEGLNGLISIIGGKLTTFRNLAEETVDTIYEKLRKHPPPCHTATTPMWGGGMKHIGQYIEENTKKYSAEFRVDEEQVAYLISIYGSRFWRVLELTKKAPELRERICPHNLDIKAQILFSLQNELPRTLADIYLRRTGIGTSACRGLDCAKEAARLMGKTLHWRRRRIKQEVENYEREIELLYGCD